MPSQFPGAFDNLTTGFQPGDLVTSSNADLVNSCLNAIEQNLGLNGQDGYTTLGAAVAGKLDMAAGGTMGADIAMGSHRVTGLADPVSAQDAATKNYVDTQLGSVTPTGTILSFAGVASPSGYLACDGSAVSRTTYAALFSALTFAQTGTTTSGSTSVTGLSSTGGMYVGMALTGTGIPASTTISQVNSTTAITISNAATQSGTPSLTFYPYGAGDGSTTFNLPDLRGRGPVGIGQGVGLSARVGGQSGGEETHVLSDAEMPNHNHNVGHYDTAQLGGASYQVYSYNSPYGTFPSSYTGGGGAHNNMQPYLVIGFAIKF